MPKVSVIIITRDREDDLQDCLSSILTQSRAPDEVIVVDDASMLPQHRVVRKLIPSAKVLRNERPLGVPGARNLGIQASAGEYLVFIDDDAVFAHPRVIEKTEEIFREKPHVGILAFKVTDPRTGRIRPHEFPHTNLERSDREFETSYYVGAGHAIRKEVTHRIGLLFDPYYYGMEESDFSWRAISAGYSIVYVPELEVHHRASPAARPTWRKVYYQTRNRIWFVFSFLPPRFIVSHLLVWMPYFAVQAIRIGRPMTFFKAIHAGLRGLPGILSRRRSTKLSHEALSKLSRLDGRLLY